MKRWLWFILFALIFAWFGKDGQAQNPSITITGSTQTPANYCDNAQIRLKMPTGVIYTCVNHTWVAQTGGGGGVGTVTSVSGTAGQIGVATGTSTPVISLVTNTAIPGSPTTTTQPCGTVNTTLATMAALNCISGSLFQAVAVSAATTTTLPANTYNNGTSGVGATLTGNANGAFAAVDGYTAGVGDRILVNNEANALRNGVYTLTTLGNGGAAYVLTRATDFNTVAEINGSGAIPTLNGTVNNNVLWILSTTISAIGTGQNNINYSVGSATPFPAYTITNASSTGTTLNKLVKLTGAPSTAVIAATNDLTGILGICLANCGTTGAAIIGYTNVLSCIFDNATTAGDYVQIGTSGACHDAGSTYPTSGGDVLGRVTSTHAAGGTYSMVWGSLDVANKTANATITVGSGTIALTTSAVGSGACSSASTVTITGTATTDSVIVSPNADPTGVTGYAVSASGSVYIWVYPTSNTVNAKVCNNSSGSLTPSALTLNVRVVR